MLRDSSEDFSLTTEGRKKVASQLMGMIMESNLHVKLQGKKQLRFLKQIYPITNKNLIPQFFRIPLISRLNLSNLQMDELIDKIIDISEYQFVLDIPEKIFQDLKWTLKQKENLTIRELLVLKIMGCENIVSPQILYKLYTTIKDKFEHIQELLDFIILLYPGTFKDYRVMLTYVPENLGFVKNEAYTSFQVISCFKRAFGSVDMDLASNVIANTYIKATKYWSLINPFFPTCQEPISGNIIINPPYPLEPLWDNLFNCLRTNMDSIENCILILPKNNMDVKKGFQISNMVQRNPEKAHSIDLAQKFRTRQAVKRTAVMMEFSIFYVGNNLEQFKLYFKHLE
jgi:hypothetical protein